MVPETGVDPACATLAAHGIALPRALHRIVRRVLIPPAALQERVREMARLLAEHYPPESEVVVTPVLTGAFMFAADLGRALATETSLDVHYALTKASTYGTAMGADGPVVRSVIIDLQPSDVAGRSMLLVDDILDHGFTLAALRDRLAEWGVRSVQVCVLLDKQLDNPDPQILAQRAKAAPDLVGFEIPDVWVAGYGLDAAGALRHLPCIVSVDKDA
jgi:hypoxanthine phosphoribosyltransferase